MNADIHADDATDSQTSGFSWASARLSALLDRHGIPSRHQATEIAQICAISISQARRKLRGAVWLFDEVHAICRHFGESLDGVFGSPVLQTSSTDHVGINSLGNTCPATLLIDGQKMTCQIQLGPLHTATQTGSEGLVAHYSQHQGWLVANAQRMAQEGYTGARYAVEQLQLRNPIVQLRTRIAVLDDDIGSADALTDWFNEVGYEAHAYNSTEALLAHPLSEHDAFVVDLILSGGQTSQSIVERIRLEQPDAPIVLLTGQLKDGTASEATLTTILRTQGVTFFEKPVRPAVLTAAIQSSLDRLAPHHA